MKVCLDVFPYPVQNVNSQKIFCQSKELYMSVSRGSYVLILTIDRNFYYRKHEYRKTVASLYPFDQKVGLSQSKMGRLERDVIQLRERLNVKVIELYGAQFLKKLHHLTPLSCGTALKTPIRYKIKNCQTPMKAEKQSIVLILSD